MERISTILAGERVPSDSAILRALIEDTACGIAVIGADQSVASCSPIFAAMLGHQSPETVRGRAINDLVPHQEAHLQALRLAATEGSPTAVDGPIGNRFTRATYRPSAEPTPGSALVTITSRPPEAAPPPGVKLLQTNEAPEISRLTRRERQVLAAIGMGLTTAEIAERIERSPKTVEGHRVSLGTKLGVTNRVQLARIAIRCGLAPLHDHLIEAKPLPRAPATRDH